MSLVARSGHPVSLVERERDKENKQACKCELSRPKKMIELILFTVRLIDLSFIATGLVRVQIMLGSRFHFKSSNITHKHTYIDTTVFSTDHQSRINRMRLLLMERREEHIITHTHL